MHKRPVVLLCCFLLSQPAISQNPAPTSPPGTVPPQEQPDAPLFLFMHGKDVTIPKGTEVTAYVNGDIPLEPARFQPDAAAGAGTGGPLGVNPSSPSAVDATLASIEIKSNPVGADITVDEKFVGDTPSALKLPAGEHKRAQGQR